MAISPDEMQQIQNKVRPLIGQKVWGVELGVGTFVTMEFGAPLQDDPRLPPRGEWHLWTYYCAWQIECDGEVLAASEDPRDLLEQTLREFNELTLLGLEITRPTLVTELRFERGMILRLFPVCTMDNNAWMLYDPTDYVLEIGPGSTWRYLQAGTAKD